MSQPGNKISTHKGKTSRSNKSIADKAYEEYSVMTILNTTAYTLYSQSHENHIRKGINDLGRVYSGIVILQKSVSHGESKTQIPYIRICHTSSHQLIVEVTGAQ